MRVALAAALVATSASAAEGYRRTPVPGKELCLSWSTRALSYSADAAGSVKTPGDTEFAAIEASFRTWQALSDSCSDFHLTAGPRLANAVVGHAPGSGPDNVVVFREVSCPDVVPPGDACIAAETCANVHRCWDHGDDTLGLTTTTFSAATGVIVDADIELNAAPHADGTEFLFTTVPSPQCLPGEEAPTCVAIDVQNTVTHEVGHLFGLDHVTADGSTMETTAPVGETRKRVIDSGTAQGFCDTYPRGSTSVPCGELGTLRRRVVAKSTGTALGCVAGTGEVSVAAVWLAGCWLALARVRSRAR